jgi:hypothetical protein
MTAPRTAFALTLIATFSLGAPAAHADRKATRAERAAIKPVALEACRSPVDDCEFRGARVSTAKARYAWGEAVGEGFSGALLKRPTRRSLRFRVVGIQGGGIGDCSYWRARAPRAVLRDLRIKGLVGDSGEVRNCGRRG